jgi:hypothetical protein
MVNSAAALEQESFHRADDRTDAIFDSFSLYKDFSRTVQDRWSGGVAELQKLAFGIPEMIFPDRPGTGSSEPRLVEKLKDSPIRDLERLLKIGLPGQTSNLEKTLGDHVVAKLDPKDREAYRAEQKAYAKYEAELSARMSQLVYGVSIDIKKPEMPMHDEVAKRRKDLELKVIEQVRSEMSPEHLADLDKQINDFDNEWRKQSSKWNPYGTGDWYIHPLPKLPAIAADYYNRIGAAARTL